MLLAAVTIVERLLGAMLIVSAVRGVLLFRNLDTPPPAAARRSFLPDDQEGWQRFRTGATAFCAVLGVVGLVVLVFGLPG
ncbi:hypothetical protein PO878_08125 [Iamia majanohamensis]|uniref:Uncharacterized protein n=1 Tax=Iamia majanohamensis TaxID=467976 RepID=A0AAF0BX41_9ACTN|nr:hypothetical protein [Iamia majanohamensis]WCO68693.1 hypothetical protein PO878_08125 [Iamia majanohamensis]